MIISTFLKPREFSCCGVLEKFPKQQVGKISSASSDLSLIELPKVMMEILNEAAE